MRRIEGVVCSGNIVIDILVRPVDEFRWGTTTWVETIEEHLGGNGANTSYTLGKLGVPVRLLGRVGGDTFGEMALGRLASAGVDLSGVERSDAETAASVVLVDSQGARLFLHRVGASAEAFPAPIEFGEGSGYSHYHLANLFALPNLRQHAARTLRNARAAGLTTSLDTAWDARGEWMAVLAPCLPLVDLLFVNEGEARMLTGLTDPSEAADRLQKLGASDMVVKLGGDGCAVFTPHEGIRAPAFDVEVRDTTGAGDCFAGAFLAGLHRGCSYEQAARLANAVGALTVQQLGATEGVRSWAETEAWMRTARTRP